MSEDAVEVDLRTRHLAELRELADDLARPDRQRESVYVCCEHAQRGHLPCRHAWTPDLIAHVVDALRLRIAAAAK